MTLIDLVTIRFLKEYKNSNHDTFDSTILFFVTQIIKRQPNRYHDIFNNISHISKNIIQGTKKYHFFKELSSKIIEKFSLKPFASIAFICWFSYYELDFKHWQRFDIDKVTDDTIRRFNDWYKLLSYNFHLIHGFKSSCQRIINLRYLKENAMQCINRLIDTDELAKEYLAGNITSYFLSTLPKINFTTNNFSTQLMSQIEKNRDVLISKLNNAAKNYMSLPVDGLRYVDKFIS